MEEGLKIDSSVIEAIRVLLYTNAWQNFFVPALENMKTGWTKEMMDPSQKRKDLHSDDYIRGCFATIEVFLRLPEALVQEADTQAEQHARERQVAESYEERARTGYIGPYVSEESVPTTD